MAEILSRKLVSRRYSDLTLHEHSPIRAEHGERRQSGSLRAIQPSGRERPVSKSWFPQREKRLPSLGP
ncbi:hypothetical protein [Azospirillum argentinense]|uniref:hypothetical protein n=1 Tax=Azospirillum argentinense TaxID=2970906 RepID=UPI0032DEFA11